MVRLESELSTSYVDEAAIPDKVQERDQGYCQGLCRWSIRARQVGAEESFSDDERHLLLPGDDTDGGSSSDYEDYYDP